MSGNANKSSRTISPAEDLEEKRQNDQNDQNELYTADEVLHLASQINGVSIERMKAIQDERASESAEESADDEVDDGYTDNKWKRSIFHPISTSKLDTPATSATSALPTSFNPCDTAFDLSKTNISEYHSPFAKAATEGIDRLVECVLEEELRLSKTLRKVPIQHLKTIGISIVMSMETAVLDALLRGNLPFLYFTDFQVRRSIQRLWKLRSSQPSCYGQWLVDANGISPSPEELGSVVKRMRRYITPENPKDIELALQIDRVKTKSWPMERTRAGVRKYLCSQNMSGQPSLDRIKEVKKFCENLMERLKALPSHKYRVPLAAPLCEIGYSKDSGKRLKAHFAHKSSNYIMCLMEATFEINFPGKYQMFRSVIFPIWCAAHAATSEIILTRICDGYTTNGGGFSHYLAGLSNASALVVGDHDWRHLTALAVSNTPWVANNRQRLQSHVKREKDASVEAELTKARIQDLQKEINKVEMAMRLHKRINDLEIAKEHGDQKEIRILVEKYNKEDFTQIFSDTFEMLVWMETYNAMMAMLAGQEAELCSQGDGEIVVEKETENQSETVNTSQESFDWRDAIPSSDLTEDEMF